MSPAESESWAPELKGWSADILPWMRRLVPTLPKPFTYYEIGAYKGRSLIFMAAEARRNGHDERTRIVGVDAPVLEAGSHSELIANVTRCAPWWAPVTVELDLAMSLDATPNTGLA